MSAVIQNLLGEVSQEFYVHYNVLQAKGGDKDGGQMIVPVKNRMCPHSLEEREFGSFKNLTWLSIPYMLAREGINVQCKEME